MPRRPARRLQALVRSKRTAHRCSTHPAQPPIRPLMRCASHFTGLALCSASLPRSSPLVLGRRASQTTAPSSPTCEHEPGVEHDRQQRIHRKLLCPRPASAACPQAVIKKALLAGWYMTPFGIAGIAYAVWGSPTKHHAPNALHQGTCHVVTHCVWPLVHVSRPPAKC